MERATARFSSTMGERCDLCERLVESDDARPIRLRRRVRSRVTRGNCCLERVGATRAGELFGAFKRSQTTTDEELIPTGAILIQ